MKIKNAIPISELTINDEDVFKPERALKHVVNIKARAKKGAPLTEHEKNFFASSLNCSVLPGESPEDYPQCQDFLYKLTYHTYAFDISGGNTYYKISKEKVREKVRSYVPGTIEDISEVLCIVPHGEANDDLEKLYKVANDWDMIVGKLNHADSLLQTISIETREQLKELDAAVLNETTKGTTHYKRKRQHLLLQSKYAYLVTKEVLETMLPTDMILEINGQQIEFNEFSIFHILSRHYAPGTKPYNTGKSFINPDFVPRQLHLQLSEIFSKIEASGAYVNNSLQKISFRYKGISYRVWTKTATKQVPGTGNVQYMRVQSFYPIEEAADLSDLANNYKLVKVDNDIDVYVGLSHPALR